MVYVIIADTPEELERAQHFFNKPKEQPAWFNKTQMTFELKQKGYKAGSLATIKKYCDHYGVHYEQRGNEIVYKNELEKIPNRI